MSESLRDTLRAEEEREETPHHRRKIQIGCSLDTDGDGDCLKHPKGCAPALEREYKVRDQLLQWNEAQRQIIERTAKVLGFSDMNAVGTIASVAKSVIEDRDEYLRKYKSLAEQINAIPTTIDETLKNLCGQVVGVYTLGRRDKSDEARRLRQYDEVAQEIMKHVESNNHTPPADEPPKPDWLAKGVLVSIKNNAYKQWAIRIFHQKLRHYYVQTFLAGYGGQFQQHKVGYVSVVSNPDNDPDLEAAILRVLPPEVQ